MNYPFQSGTLPYTWASVVDHWPLRLLHIPSMTSVERDELNFYSRPRGMGMVEKPKYNILTYTWGRWKIRDATGDPALPVLHTPWQIPAVKEEHFAVKEFQKVVDFLRWDGIEWAWIDVACIHQEDEAANSQEVGRQASIFKNAHRVFVWLSTLHKDVLAPTVTTIMDHGLQMRDHIDNRATSLPIEDIIGLLHREFKVIFTDPWFSSLWTLQEVVLRNDAIVLSKEAEAIEWYPNETLYLTMFINHCQNMFQDLERINEDIEKSISSGKLLQAPQLNMKTQISAMKDLIYQAGFYYLFSTNPNVQYGIAQHRKTSREVDRVYAIMQIYNLRVGKSIDLKRAPTLPELIDEFAVAINHRCPILGQMFVHTRTPDQGKSWRITQASTVPDCLMMYKNPKPQCTLKYQSRIMVATGRRCPFADLNSVVLEVKEADALDLGFMLSLDGHVINGLAWRQGPMSRLSNSNIHGRQLLLQYGPKNLLVLLLGDVEAEKSPRGGYNRTQVGLLLAPASQGDREDLQRFPYQRLGVCTWTAREKWHEEYLKKLNWGRAELEIQ